MDKGNFILKRLVISVDQRKTSVDIYSYEAKKIPSGYMVWRLEKVKGILVREGNSARRISQPLDQIRIGGSDDIISLFGTVFFLEEEKLSDLKDLMVEKLEETMKKRIAYINETVTRVEENFELLKTER